MKKNNSIEMIQFEQIVIDAILEPKRIRPRGQMKFCNFCKRRRYHKVIEKKIVIEMAKKNPAAAKKNGDEFLYIVRGRWWSEVVNLWGYELKTVVEILFVRSHPEFGSQEGFMDPLYYGTEIEMELDETVMAMIEQIIEIKHEEIGFHEDWGDLPVVMAEPQLAFKMEV